MSNESDLEIYVTKLDLTTRFYDYSNVYFLPIVCLFGLLTSVFSLIGSARKGMSKSITLKFIFINSFVDVLFLLTQFFVFLFRCGALCTFGYDYFPQLYEIEIFWFAGYALVNSQVFFGIYVSVGRLRLFARKNATQKQNMFIAFIFCAFISILVNLLANSIPYKVVEMGIYQPDNITSQILYSTDYVSYFTIPAMRNLLTVVFIIKDPIMYMFYCVINILVVVRFQQFKAKKLLLASKINLSKTFFSNK